MNFSRWPETTFVFILCSHAEKLDWNWAKPLNFLKRPASHSFSHLPLQASAVNQVNKPPTIMNHHHPSQLPNHLNVNHQSNHLSPLNPTALLNQSLNNTNALGGHHQGLHPGMQLPPPAGMYDLHPNMGMNGLSSNMQKVQSAEQFIHHMGQHTQQPHPSQHLAQNQCMPQNQNQYLPRNNVNINVSRFWFCTSSVKGKFGGF